MLALLWLLQRRLSRRGPRRRPADGVKILSRQGVGAKAQVVVAQIDDSRYVLGVTEHGITVLDRLPASPDDDAAEVPARASTGSFESILASSSPPDVLAEPTRLRVRHRSDPLRGSILSPETWRQTGEALRRAR